MPDSLLFDGDADAITVDDGDFVGTGALTIGLVVKGPWPPEYQLLVGFGSAEGVFLTTSHIPRRFRYRSPSGTPEPDGSVHMDEDVWTLVAVSKTAGSTVPRFHAYDGSSWAHGDGSEAAANQSDPDDLLIGGGVSGQNDFTGNILVCGFWDSALSDGSVEALEGGLQAWVDAAPEELFRLNSMSSLSSLTGSATEQSRVGTSLDSGDAPAWWSDDLVGEPPAATFLPARRRGR